jgi:hypothetical protein
MSPRPAVNVNTAPEALLIEILRRPLRLEENESTGRSDAKAEALAEVICARRPFANRHELEDLVFRFVGHQRLDRSLISWPDNGALEQLSSLATPLTERQFNDVLNSFSGVLSDDDSAFDEPDAIGNPGVYSFDGWEPYNDLVGPSQTGGDCSDWAGLLASDASDARDNVTWATELAFRSRFFHIYVVGRGWHEATSDAVGVKRLHAIYDSAPPGGGPGRIVWLRWNLTSRGSIVDVALPP